MCTRDIHWQQFPLPFRGMALLFRGFRGGRQPVCQQPSNVFLSQNKKVRPSNCGASSYALGEGGLSTPSPQPLNPGPFGPPQVVKLGDFGISTILRGSQALAKTQCGTPYYFSPGVPAALRSPGCDCTGIQGRCSRDRLSSMHWGYCYPAVDANGCIGTQPLNRRLGVPRLLVLVTGQFT